MNNLGPGNRTLTELFDTVWFDIGFSHAKGNFVIVPQLPDTHFVL